MFNGGGGASHTTTNGITNNTNHNNINHSTHNRHSPLNLYQQGLQSQSKLLQQHMSAAAASGGLLQQQRHSLSRISLDKLKRDLMGAQQSQMKKSQKRMMEKTSRMLHHDQHMDQEQGMWINLKFLIHLSLGEKIEVQIFVFLF